MLSMNRSLASSQRSPSTLTGQACFAISLIYDVLLQFDASAEDGTKILQASFHQGERHIAEREIQPQPTPTSHGERLQHRIQPCHTPYVAGPPSSDRDHRSREPEQRAQARRELRTQRMHSRLHSPEKSELDGVAFVAVLRSLCESASARPQHQASATGLRRTTPLELPQSAFAPAAELTKYPNHSSI